MSGWTPEEEDDLSLAGEYVLGLLEPEEQRTFEGRLALEPWLREAVARWSEDLATLLDEVPAVPPPRGAEEALMRRLFPEERTSRRRGWSLWPVLMGGAVAAGLALFAFGTDLLDPRGEPEYAARIAAEDESLIVEALFDADRRELRVDRSAGAIPEGQDLELWLIQGEEVRSLGVIPQERSGIMQVSADLAPGFEGGQLALTVEPPGGSPTGVATGPIVAAGPVTGL